MLEVMTVAALLAALVTVYQMYRDQYNRRTKTKQHEKMSKASYNAFIDGLKQNRRRTLRENVYQAIVTGPKTVRQLQMHLHNQGLKPATTTITGRVSELQDLGAIQEREPGVYAVCRTEAEQALQREARYAARKERWLAEGKRNGWLS